MTERLLLPSSWVPNSIATLTFLLHEDSVLLIEKRTGHGAGKINAPGGRVEPGELPHEGAIREVREEVGIEVARVELAALLRFDDPCADFRMVGHIFTATDFCGVAKESSEAKPFWVRRDSIPYPAMWATDALWLPQLLDGKRVIGDLIYENDVLQSHKLTFTTRELNTRMFR